MLNIIKGIINRIIKNKAYLLMAFVVTPIVIISAIYFNDSSFSKINIAVVGENTVNWDSDKVNITVVNSRVPKSDLVKNKYDAVVYFNRGQATVDSVKSKEFVSRIENMINGQDVSVDVKDKKGVITNIASFIVMFMLFLGIMLYKYYFDERNGIYKRIIMSNISYGEYIGAHLIAVFIMIELPVVIFTILAKSIFNLETSVTNGQIIIIFTALSMLSASFGMLVSSIVRDSQSASMLGAMINVITTIMSGCFFSITNGGIIGKLSSVLPQRNILDITIALENDIRVSRISILNVAVIIVFLIAATFSINIYKMKKNKYA